MKFTIVTTGVIFICLASRNLLRIVSCGSMVQIDMWSIRSFTELITLRYYHKVNPSSKIMCAVSCRKTFDCDQIYMEDKVCYCLAPSYVPLSDTTISGEVTLTTHNYIYQIYHDKSECVKRHYTLFTGTNYCLKLGTTQLPWIDAEQYCKQDGGHLVSVQTMEKMTNILSLGQNLRAVFVGGYLPPEAPDNSIYRWMSHERVNNSFWLPGEPNGYNYEHLVELLKTGHLNNNNGLHDLDFFCEILIHELA